MSTIGHTPIVRFESIERAHNLSGRIYAKLEYVNPGGSKKDRIAKYIIDKAKSTGLLRVGQEVVEATSGNTGIGLAIVCSQLGHPFTAFISEGNTNERVVLMEYLGANVKKVPSKGHSEYGKVGGTDIAEVRKLACEYARETDAYFVDQFNNPWNVEAQTKFGEEVVELFVANATKLDLFCDFVGTGGCFTGASKALKQWDNGIECYVVEPVNAATLTDGSNPVLPHIIQGGGYGYTYDNLPLLDKSLVDGHITVSDAEAKEGMRLIARLQGIFGSISSGANLMAAIKLLSTPGASGKHVLICVCDTGWKYLSIL